MGDDLPAESSVIGHPQVVCLKNLFDDIAGASSPPLRLEIYLLMALISGAASAGQQGSPHFSSPHSLEYHHP